MRIATDAQLFAGFNTFSVNCPVPTSPTGSSFEFHESIRLDCLNGARNTLLNIYKDSIDDQLRILQLFPINTTSGMTTSAEIEGRFELLDAQRLAESMAIIKAQEEELLQKIELERSFSFPVVQPIEALTIIEPIPFEPIVNSITAPTPPGVMPAIPTPKTGGGGGALLLLGFAAVILGSRR